MPKRVNPKRHTWHEPRHPKTKQSPATAGSPRRTRRTTVNELKFVAGFEATTSKQPQSGGSRTRKVERPSSVLPSTNFKSRSLLGRSRRLWLGSSTDFPGDNSMASAFSPIGANEVSGLSLLLSRLTFGVQSAGWSPACSLASPRSSLSIVESDRRRGSRSPNGAAFIAGGRKGRPRPPRCAQESCETEGSQQRKSPALSALAPARCFDT